MLATNINIILQAINDQERMHNASMRKAGPSDSVDTVSTRLVRGVLRFANINIR